MMWKTLTVIYTGWLAMIVVSADIGLLSPLSGWLHGVPYRDKVCHFVFVGILSFLACMALSHAHGSRRRKVVVVCTILTIALLTSLEEFSQHLFVTRQFSQLDMLCNIAGTLIFGSLALLFPISKTASTGCVSH